MFGHLVVRAHLGLLLYAILISTSFPIANYLGSSYSPLLTTWGRFLLAAFGFVLLMAKKRQLHWPGWVSVGRYALISLPLTGFFLLMFIAGESATSLAMGSLMTLTPLASIMFAWLLWRDPFHIKRPLVLVMGVMGALWVLTDGNFSKLANDPWPSGNTVFIGACLLMGLYPLILQSLHRKEPMLVVTGWSLITGVVWLSIAILVLQPELVLPSAPQFAAICWLAVATTMATFYLFQSASLVVGGSSANAYGLLSPVFVLLITIAEGAVAPSMWVLPGVAMIVATLLLLLRLDRS